MIDLHMHSTFSDGELTPEQLMEKIAAAGLTAAALTDHDVIDGCKAFKEAASAYGITAINGSELSVDYPQVSMEILAIDIPERNVEEFRKRQKFMIAERERVAKERLRLLGALGISLRWEDVALDGKGKPRTQIGKPHIVSAMLKAGYIQNWDEGFDKYLNRGCPAHVAKNEPSAKDVIAFVLDNGAVPILAHPIHTKRTGRGLTELLDDLRAAGLMGIEVFHSDHSAVLRREYLQLIEAYGLMTAGGSDFHGGAHPGVNVGIGKGDLNIPDLVLDVIRERRINSLVYYSELQKYI